MGTTATQFQFIYNLSLINAEKKKTGGIDTYLLNFPNEIPSVSLVCLQLDDGTYEWDTLPTGNKALAAGFGKIIEQHLREHPIEDDEGTRHI